MDAWLKKAPGNASKAQLNASKAAPASASNVGSADASKSTAAAAAAANSTSTSKAAAGSSSKKKDQDKPVTPFQLLQPPPKISVTDSRTVDPDSVPWVEKYRPKTIEDVAAQEYTVNVLRKTLQSANLPHMLFYGPPGTGKTSTILALAKQLFGPTVFKSRVLELNASDERGISVVRDKIKNFAKIALSSPPASEKDYPCPPYKIIILDEADSMTQDAQSALRRIMEAHSKITRFCLICNYVTRIIEPITSRCSKFRFKPLDSSNALARLQAICENEKVPHEPGALEALIQISDGDLRKAITFLQSASKLLSAGAIPGADDETGNKMTVASVREIGGVLPESLLRRLTKAMGVPDLPEEQDDDDAEMNGSSSKKAKSPFDQVRSAVIQLAREGYSATQALSQLHDALILHPLIPSRAKATIALTLGEADKCLTDGAEEELQLFDVCLKVQEAVKQG